MKTPAAGAALAGLGLLLANSAVVTDAASAAPLTTDAVNHGISSPDAHPGTSGVPAEISVSSAQLAAYTSLSASLRDKLGSGEDTQVALKPPRDTIMCPW
jgi:hypothetical protein